MVGVPIKGKYGVEVLQLWAPDRNQCVCPSSCLSICPHSSGAWCVHGVGAIVSKFGVCVLLMMGRPDCTCTVKPVWNDLLERHAVHKD